MIDTKNVKSNGSKNQWQQIYRFSSELIDIDFYAVLDKPETFEGVWLDPNLPTAQFCLNFNSSFRKSTKNAKNRSETRWWLSGKNRWKIGSGGTWPTNPPGYSTRGPSSKIQTAPKRVSGSSHFSSYNSCFVLRWEIKLFVFFILLSINDMIKFSVVVKSLHIISTPLRQTKNFSAAPFTGLFARHLMIAECLNFSLFSFFFQRHV